MNQHGSKLVQMGPNKSTWVKMKQNGLKWVILVLNRQNRSKLVNWIKTGQTFSEWIQIGKNLLKVGKIGQTLSELVEIGKMGQNWSTCYEGIKWINEPK